MNLELLANTAIAVGMLLLMTATGFVVFGRRW